MVGATSQKILKIRSPRLAKNVLAQCYIKLSFIAESFDEIVKITLKSEENTIGTFKNK